MPNMSFGTAFVIALLYSYLTVGLLLGCLFAGFLNGKSRLPAKYEREAVKLEKQAMDRGIDVEMLIMLLVLCWPRLLARGNR